MGFRLRHEDGDHYHSGTWIAPDGTPTPLAPDALLLTPLETTRLGEADVPTRWRVEVPEYDLDLTLDALNPDSRMATIFPYWEGPVLISGSHSGRGYLEMTGY